MTHTVIDNHDNPIAAIDGTAYLMHAFDYAKAQAWKLETIRKSEFNRWQAPSGWCVYSIGNGTDPDFMDIVLYMR